MLRCNTIMRGVQVPAGQHTIVFRFQPSLTGMKVTLAAVALGLALWVGLAISRRKPDDEPIPAAPDKPVPKPASAKAKN
jgi:hypothetical protein